MELFEGDTQVIHAGASATDIRVTDRLQTECRGRLDKASGNAWNR